MAKVNSILNQRLAVKEHKPKMSTLAEQSVAGQLTSFSGVFAVQALNDHEKEQLKEILNRFADETLESTNLEGDLRSLTEITSEVKAINNQAAILHGERIKKAQDILKKYQDGAFSAWLMATYGNRQTPYNFLQYFEFYTTLPKALHSQMESMPRQAVYSLASRSGSLEKKIEIIKNFNGQTKAELLIQIRDQFPLSDRDGRKENLGDNVLSQLKRVAKLFDRDSIGIASEQKKQLLSLLSHIRKKIENS